MRKLFSLFKREAKITSEVLQQYDCKVTITNTCTTQILYYIVYWLLASRYNLTSQELEESIKYRAVLIHCFDLYTFLVWLVCGGAAAAAQWDEIHFEVGQVFYAPWSDFYEIGKGVSVYKLYDVFIVIHEE